jgi:CRISPR-associated exonuclease Cas4
MLDNDLFFTVTDIKQYAYCPRVIYYERCLPHLRPRTVKMDAGHRAHEAEQKRAARRNFSAYAIGSASKRLFDEHLECSTLGLHGAIDELVISTEGLYFPVDYKLTKKVSKHHRHQLTAYALLIEANYQTKVPYGYIYLIPSREMMKVTITTQLRNSVHKTLNALHKMVTTEEMPSALPRISACVNCEFRRFCNDVL